LGGFSQTTVTEEEKEKRRKDKQQDDTAAVVKDEVHLDLRLGSGKRSPA
jgi:hypothetical protein